MFKKLAVTLFNILPVYFQYKAISIEKRFKNKIRFLDLLNTFPHFSFIQVGANDGISFDSLHEYIINHGTIKIGIAIEPIQEYFEELKINYAAQPNIKCIKYALHPSLSEIEMYKVNNYKNNSLPVWAKGIASINQNHHIKLGIPNQYISKEKVCCKTLKQIFHEFGDNVTHFNLLQIDTEGFDSEIIKMIDFNTMKFDIIKFERVNLEAISYKETFDTLNENNYFIWEDVEDTIAIRKDIKLFLK